MKSCFKGHPGSNQSHAVLFAIGVLLACGSVVWACNVPVFRFALERWRQDPYRAVLFYRGDLSEADRELMRPLEEQGDASLINLTFREVDVSQLDTATENADAALFASLNDPKLPSLVVQYPAHLNIQKPVWAGSLERESTAKLTDSPLRQELIRRLTAGQTAVWLLLETGKGEQNDTAAALVETELKKLEQELKLPELTSAPEDAILSDTPLRVEFSMLRVKRDAEAEQALVATLIGSEPDLAERTDPMLFPVFGRGRALLPLIGAGITAKNIHDSASFLVGPCSCEVKELNPGFDLLLAADWDGLLSQSGVSLTAATTPSQPPPAVAELVPIPAGAPAVAPVIASSTDVPPTPSEALQTSATGLLPRRKVLFIAGSILTGILVIALIVASGRSRASA